MNKQETVTLSCGFYGNGRVRPVRAALTATTLHLADIVTRELGTQPQGHIVLYLARDATGKYLPHDENTRELLRGPVISKYDPLPLLAQLNDPLCFGVDFSPESNEMHVLVELLDEEPPTKKRRLSDHGEDIASIGLSDLWDLSKMTLTQVPAKTKEIAAILQRPLPFRLQMADTALADRICSQDGPKVRCQPLAALFDAFSVGCSLPVDPKASKATWQKFYDELLRIPAVFLHSKGLDATQIRSHSTDSAGESLRPDVIMHHQGLVLLRGEEADTRVWLGTPRARLTKKMREWSRMFYGDLPYTLGYVTSGDWLGIVVVGEDLYGGLALEIRSIRRLVADTIKVFFNLPFLVQRMITVSKFRRLTQLTPYTPVEGEKCTIELLDGVIERTIERRQCEDDEAFERLVCIYKTLQELGDGNDTENTHLQTVESLELPNEYKLVVKLTPLGSCREPADAEEVREWVKAMLTALSFWHGRNYCHGDVCWRNIVHVPDEAQPGRWVLIDMDESRRPDTTIIEWNHPCEGEQLTFRHDLFQLGKLLKQLHPSIKLPRDLLAIQDKLLRAMEDSAMSVHTVAVMLRKK